MTCRRCGHDEQRCARRCTRWLGRCRPVDDARLARVADRAKGGGSALTVSRGGGRRRWVVGGLAVAAVAVLVVCRGHAGAASGRGDAGVRTGSLPDQIFPTREHILTLEQAPIGRVSMVYAGPLLGGVTSWVAVGADTDEYRALARASAHMDFNDTVDVAPDGSTVVIGRGGERSGDLRLEFVDASSGQTKVVRLPDDGAGGRVDSLLWGSNDNQVGVLASVTDPSDVDGSSAHFRAFVVDVSTGVVAQLPSRAVQVGEMAGWLPDGRLVFVDQPGTSGPSAGRLVVSAADQSDVTRLATLSRLQLGFSLASISPDGRLLAGLADSDPGVSGAGVVMDLQVYELSTGDQVFASNLASYVGDRQSIVGWRDATTPVLSAIRAGADGPGLLVAYDAKHGTHEVIVRAGVEGIPRYYATSRVASDILASGAVRKAQPPNQPWYDPRTAWPAFRDWANSWTGANRVRRRRTRLADPADQPSEAPGSSLSIRFMTVGSASVVTSPMSRCSATSRSRRRMILPERVFGSSGTTMI